VQISVCTKAAGGWLHERGGCPNKSPGTTLPARTPPKLMIELSKPMTVGEIEAAATYFSALQPRKRIKVVERDTAPKTNVAFCFGLRWKPESASRSERGS
jgi:hypothetical protein